MPETDPQNERTLAAKPDRIPDPARWRRLRYSLSSKLIVMLLLAMVMIFSLLGVANIYLHRKNLESATLTAAERVSDTIKRSASYHMMQNDRPALYDFINRMGAEPGIVKIRIFNPEGRISFSTDSAEVGNTVDMAAEACTACHAQSQPLARVNRQDRFRIYKPNGHRVLGIITPIENQPACSNAACHAHPASQQILGVIDSNLSLEKADASVRKSSLEMLALTIVAMVLIGALSAIFVWRVLDRPIGNLIAGTKKLSTGDLGYQIEVESHDELGELADEFNSMSLKLMQANEEITAWAKTLEERVDEKTTELKAANEHVLHVEKMVSLGKMAAVVAHEINNPLSGILTYAKLLKRWIDKVGVEEGRRKEMKDCLDLIESESKRCGDLVKNLLKFSRSAPLNMEWNDLNSVVNRTVMLVQHQMDLAGIQVQTELDPMLPTVQCDGAQLEQVFLALIMNAHDAMPKGGNLWVRTRYLPQSEQIEIQIRDDGSGISPEVMKQLFEPFFTTKEGGRGVGLGLAISRGIVERHRGVIEVESQLGKGTTFYIFIPTGARGALEAAAKANAVSAR